ncbi:hypothetical protein CXB65_19095 [Pseudomonas monteilii]|uniref:Uncharacterized protein n=1 Tax=Pseudomonas monteilii TaxID=76759 RepID=A0A2N1IND0_9PSED|nr:hypothetical protein CXB65_19095 [Pseudomonas monteilii]RPD92394.1 hypothetical protein EGN69_19950 [Pseudomonas monteilii]
MNEYLLDVNAHIQEARSKKQEARSKKQEANSSVLTQRTGRLRWRHGLTFSPLRRVTFCQTRQKVTKKRCAPIIRPLRCAPGSPHSGLAPGRTAPKAPSWGLSA